MLALPDANLDLGCGSNPRNPYRRGNLHGIDIHPMDLAPGIGFVVANLTLEPIPFPGNAFGSVSAFDFLEHVPRVLMTRDGTQTFSPFISVMNEIWRVLAPGGLLYALTPAYPSPAAFQDPTHVNIITEETHTYFCGDKPYGSIYGFNGRFTARRAHWAVYKDSQLSAPLTFRQRYRLSRHRSRGKLTHFLWELEAVKSSG